MALEDLYRGPLEDFVARRTELVRELRKSDPDAARAAAKLRKPSAGVWAINQLAAADPTLLTELLAAGADARDAQYGVAAGTASREDLAVATGRLRDGVEAAARAAIDLLEHAGHGAGDDIARRIRTTLQAAATGGADQRQALWTGRLDHELDVAGFGAADDPENDPEELAAALAPLRRTTSPEPRAVAQNRPSSDLGGVARRAAGRSAANLDAAAERARTAADAARHEAERLAKEGRDAADKAAAAEQAAEAAEQSARHAHAALDG